MKIALGTVQFGLNYGISNQAGQVMKKRVLFLDLRKPMELAHSIQLLDTAGEQRLGEIGVEQWEVISKLPAIPDSCTDVGAWVQNRFLVH